MNYQKLIRKVAKHYGVSQKEVDAEIKKAIQYSGYQMKPEDFIKMCLKKLK